MIGVTSKHAGFGGILGLKRDHSVVYGGGVRIKACWLPWYIGIKA